MRVEYGYAMILGVMLRGKEHGSSAKVQNTESDSAKHNHLYFHSTFVCTYHIKVFRSVFASFVIIIDAGCICPLYKRGSLPPRLKLNKYRNTRFKNLYKNTQNINCIRFSSICIRERISILCFLWKSRPSHSFCGIKPVSLIPVGKTMSLKVQISFKWSKYSKCGIYLFRTGIIS